jgi:hypothetical protein
MEGRGSSVSIMTRLRAGRPVFRVPAGAGKEYFVLQRPDQLWDPLNLLSNGYRGALSSGVKRPGREANRSPPTRTEVKECVELYLHSPNTSSWRGV